MRNLVDNHSPPLRLRRTGFDKLGGDEGFNDEWLAIN